MSGLLAHRGLLLKPAQSVAGSIVVSTFTMADDDVTAAGYDDFWLFLGNGVNNRQKASTSLIGGPSYINVTRASGPTYDPPAYAFSDSEDGSANSPIEGCDRFMMTDTGADAEVIFTFPAGTASRTVKMPVATHVQSGYSGTPQIRVSLSDGSASENVTDMPQANEDLVKTGYLITYNASSAGQTLTVKLRIPTAGAGGVGPQMFAKGAVYDASP